MFMKNFLQYEVFVGKEVTKIKWSKYKSVLQNLTGKTVAETSEGICNHEQ